MLFYLLVLTTDIGASVKPNSILQPDENLHVLLVKLTNIPSKNGLGLPDSEQAVAV